MDGLRAVAIGGVLLYHLGVPGLPGGFTGVDVFFVISGYLITRIILSQKAKGEFSFARFYERRVRRIIPALAVVMFANLALGFYLQTPDDYAFTAKSTIATSLFGANVFYWREANYFSSIADLQSLIHTWSLAVEEQFYLIFPLFLAIGLRFVKGAWLILAALVGSLALSVMFSAEKPAAAFYLLPARAFELAMGACLAVGALPSVASKAANEALSALGLALIVASFVFIDSATVFPGYWAMVPCLGALLLIWANTGTKTLVGSALSLKPVVFVGLISYSLYIWHWPIIVAWRNLTAELEFGLATKLQLAAMSLAVAAASYRFVERPFRDARVTSARTVIAFSAGSIALLIGLSAFVVTQNGLPSRLSDQALAFADGQFDPAEAGFACLNAPLDQVLSGQSACSTGDPNDPDAIALWGDSYAAAIAPALIDAAAGSDRSVVQLTASLCPPLADAAFGMRTPSEQAACDERNANILDRLAGTDAIGTVVLFGSYARYANVDGAKLVEGLATTIERLAAAGKRVVLVHGLHQPRSPVPWMLSRLASTGRELPRAQPPREAWLDEVVARADAGERLTLLDLSAAVCDGNSCPYALDGRSLFSDDGHLSQYANDALLKPYFEEYFEGG